MGGYCHARCCHVKVPGESGFCFESVDKCTCDMFSGKTTLMLWHSSEHSLERKVVVFFSAVLWWKWIESCEHLSCMERKGEITWLWSWSSCTWLASWWWRASCNINSQQDLQQIVLWACENTEWQSMLNKREHAAFAKISWRSSSHFY